MPQTASLFAIGAAAICGLPPLNGFVSELLVYVGLLRVAADGVAGAWSAAPLAAPLLAMAGALAIACFVKVFGAVFLGPRRSEHAARAHESPRSMRLAMALLALGCVAVGTLPAAADAGARSGRARVGRDSMPLRPRSPSWCRGPP